MSNKIVATALATLFLVGLHARPSEAAKACTCELQIDKQDPILWDGNGSSPANDWAQFKINLATPPHCKEVDTACEAAIITYKWSVAQIIYGKVAIDGPDDNSTVKLSHAQKAGADFILSVSVSLICNTKASGEQKPIVYEVRRTKNDGSAELAF
jgi:hypothetical protein